MRGVWGVMMLNLALKMLEGQLENGNFEEAPKSSDLNATVVLKSNAIPHWQTSGFVEYIKVGQKQGLSSAKEIHISFWDEGFG
ncbi:BIIDXI-like protein At5g11420 [Henckelia pumila]|uniref:BIIDXI-like protein At5g11420 n=1 Tax=Henckelia pumila TaxID=405737 RepID=UPI003C6DC232